MSIRLAGDRVLPLDRPLIMGVLNVTPDSFSDGGRFADAGAAVAQAARMLDEGADLLDVGGESTRPGAQRVPEEVQLQRVLPVIERIMRERAAIVSIDTTRAAVAAAALDVGAAIVNDVSAGRDDPAMLPLVARRGAAIILMHMRGDPATMQHDPRYADVVGEVELFLLDRAAAATAAGVQRDRVLIDPGLGFGKTLEHNLALMAGLRRLVATGYPVVLGASRKRFVRTLCNDASPDDVIGGTCATTALGVAAGVAICRVHDVAPNRQAAAVAWAVRDAGPPAPGVPRPEIF
jgi:dihydropteroate synthase